MQRQPQDHQDNDDRDDAVDDGAFLNRRILLIGNGDRAGQPDAGMIVLGKLQVGRGFTDRVGRLLAGFQRLVIDDRLDLDEGTLVRIRKRLRAHQFAPGKGRILFGQHLLDRLGNIGKGPRRVVDIGLTALDPGQPGLQRPGEATDRRIACHDLDQGSCGLKLRGGTGHLLRGQKKQAIAGKKFARAERLNRLEVLLVTLEPVRQRCRRRVRQFRGRRLDHGEDQFLAIERPLELHIALAPVEFGGNQFIDIGIDRKMADRIDARGDRQGERQDQDERCKARTGLNNRDDNICQHFVSFRCWEARRKRPLSSGVPWTHLMLVLVTVGTRTATTATSLNGVERVGIGPAFRQQSDH